MELHTCILKPVNETVRQKACLCVLGLIHKKKECCS